MPGEENKNPIENISIGYSGAAAGTRIPDISIKSRILYQLSYSNISYTYVTYRNKIKVVRYLFHI